MIGLYALGMFIYKPNGKWSLIPTLCAGWTRCLRGRRKKMYPVVCLDLAAVVSCDQWRRHGFSSVGPEPKRGDGEALETPTSAETWYL